jgi:hypothetical protein
VGTAVQTIKEAIRLIHAAFQALLAGKPHGDCGKAFELPAFRNHAH